MPHRSWWEDFAPDVGQGRAETVHLYGDCHLWITHYEPSTGLGSQTSAEERRAYPECEHARLHFQAAPAAHIIGNANAAISYLQICRGDEPPSEDERACIIPRSSDAGPLVPRRSRTQSPTCPRRHLQLEQFNGQRRPGARLARRRLCMRSIEISPYDPDPRVSTQGPGPSCLMNHESTKRRFVKQLAKP